MLHVTLINGIRKEWIILPNCFEKDFPYKEFKTEQKTKKRKERREKERESSICLFLVMERAFPYKEFKTGIKNTRKTKVREFIQPLCAW